ncbi:MAG: hypothetical protein ABIQ31_25235 [Ferruginibacter sp.]
MMLKLKSPILLVILSILFYSCEKEYSLEGNAVGSTAVFTLSGAPAACATAVVTGTYQVGVALDATALVTIAVDVTTIGNYSISTAIINGISFTGAGAFTVTGTQTITLTGSGVPLAAGSFPFTPGANGCIFPVVVTNSVPSTSAFTYTGAPNACTTATPAGSYMVGTALSASNTITIGVNVTTPGTWSVSTPVVNGFSFSGSGNFTTATPQTIILTATGTPVAEGVFNFTPSNNGCSFPITVLTGTVATDFLKCKIDGTARTFNVDLVASSGLASTFSLGGNESSAANTAQFEIDLSKSPNITTGTYNKFSATNLSTFCIGGYNDGVAATTWSIGILQAGGFTVNVTTFTATRIEGTFSGTLYEGDGLGSGTKLVTEGQFSVPY